MQATLENYGLLAKNWYWMVGWWFAFLSIECVGDYSLPEEIIFLFFFILRMQVTPLPPPPPPPPPPPDVVTPTVRYILYRKRERQQIELLALSEFLVGVLHQEWLSAPTAPLAQVLTARYQLL